MFNCNALWGITIDLMIIDVHLFWVVKEFGHRIKLESKLELSLFLLKHLFFLSDPPVDCVTMLWLHFLSEDTPSMKRRVKMFYRYWSLLMWLWLSFPFENKRKCFIRNAAYMFNFFFLCWKIKIACSKNELSCWVFISFRRVFTWKTDIKLPPQNQMDVWFHASLCKYTAFRCRDSIPGSLFVSVPHIWVRCSTV